MYNIFAWKVRWIGEDKQETWEPECNVPKAMVDAFEMGDQEPRVNSQQIVEQFGITAVTNIKVKVGNDRNIKRMKKNESALNGRYGILMYLEQLI